MWLIYIISFIVIALAGLGVIWIGSKIIRIRIQSGVDQYGSCSDCWKVFYWFIFYVI